MTTETKPQHTPTPPCSKDGFCEKHDGVHPMEMRHFEKGIPIRQHSPTPWKLKSDDRIGDYLVDKDGDSIEMNYSEDAAFIVRAVNCHEELVRLLKSVTTIKLMYDDPRLFSEIQQAIAQAEAQ